MLFRITFVLPNTTIGIRNCALNRKSIDLDGESVAVLDGSESHNMQRWPHRIVSLKITWCFTLISF